ncbi:MAG: hypothetical protein JWQ54_1399 [Mucilaginibacter sp.]|nr:hypothetical protein [Mucilaginibacter sp.]
MREESESRESPEVQKTEGWRRSESQKSEIIKEPKIIKINKNHFPDLRTNKKQNDETEFKHTTIKLLD